MWQIFDVMVDYGKLQELRGRSPFRVVLTSEQIISCETGEGAGLVCLACDECYSTGANERDQS